MGVRQDYIVQAESVEVARSAVVRVGGVVTGDLSIIRAVGAALDDRELEALRASDVPRLRIFEDSPVQSSSAAGVLPETNYPSEVAASNLHVGGVTGRGVTVAVLDSGVWSSLGPLQTTPYQTPHVLAQYDVIQARTQSTYKQTAALQNYSQSINDLFGHGTHISSIIASSGVATTGKFQGVAPGGNLVSVRVLDSTG
ncbi:MAG TPA: S8 family serine peptidase, partial [Gemmatimonadales bacterium]|nr:S8 family serine peptidase [Gemmatimonadales bacterium]